MAKNLLPEIFERPLRQFPGLIPNLFAYPWQNFFEEGMYPEGLQSQGVTMYEENNKLHIEIPLPGLELKDIEVTMNKGVLYVRGESKEEEKNEKKKFYRRSNRKYSYAITLPTQISEKQEPQALYNEGILNVTVDLATPKDTKKINVKQGNSKKR